ncbi:MAG TPA: AAA family ATPase [Candidatus Binatia bacterium]
MSAKHREAFAHLVYGIREGSGFVAITGEVGAGKTTLIRTLLAEHAQDVTVANIVNPVLTSTELLQTINAELGLPSRSTSRKELIEELAAFLKTNRAAGRRTVIIVDEAQNLDPVVLEQLRLLTNLETETEKLLQVVLVGQPELHGILSRHDLRQLNQRVTERWHLDKLDRDEACEYVRHRLRIAGAHTDLVEPRALELIYRFTDGVPRLLNILAHRSMLVAFTRSRGRVGSDEVSAAARELGYVPQVAASRGPAWGRIGAFLAAAAAAAVVAFFLLSSSAVDESRPAPRKAKAAMTSLPAAPAAKLADPGGDAPRNGDAPVSSPSAPALSPSAAATAPSVSAPAPAAAIPVPASEVAPQVASAPVVAPAPGVAPASASSDAAALATLSTGAVFDAAVADYTRLLQMWGAAPVAEADLAGGSLNLQAIAESRGLRYFAVELNDALLSVLDLPAMVEMTTGGAPEIRYVLLRGIDRTGGAVQLAGNVTMSLAGFDAAWNGKAHILFKDPESLRFDIGPGAGGPAVKKLQTMLSSAGVLDASTQTGLYDDLTENAVRRFQESRHVTADGVAGPITQVLLYNSLARFDRPTLAAGRASVAARVQGTT